MKSPRDHHLLVLSDLHLGCDLKPASPFGDASRAGLDRQLARFLDSHAARREGGKRWRLLLDGDVFDFVAVTAVPGTLAGVPFAIDAEERLFGLAPEEEKCVWKLRRIAARHEEVFHALARFLVAGHEVHFIRGNHDAELQFPSVQAELARLLARRAGVEGAEEESLRARIAFHSWFYLEPGALYVEHGNAHNRYCLQSGFFDEGAETAGELELPLSSKVLRFFASRWASSQDDLDGADQMSPAQYLAWVFRMGNPLRIALDYFAMVARLLLPVARRALALGPRARAAAPPARTDAQRVSRVQRWLAASGDPALAREGVARALLAVASRPAEQSLLDSAQLFFVDRMLLMAAAATGTLFALLLAGGVWKLGGVAAAALSFALANSWLARRRRCDAHVLLLAAAAPMARILGVREVVMGHSHRPVDAPLEGGVRYLNLGAWSPAGPGLPYARWLGERAELRSFVSEPVACHTSRPAPRLLGEQAA